jgi:hypothetical protein
VASAQRHEPTRTLRELPCLPTFNLRCDVQVDQAQQRTSCISPLQVLVANLATRAQASQGVKRNLRRKMKRNKKDRGQSHLPASGSDFTSGSEFRQSRVTRFDAECMISHLECTWQTPQIPKSNPNAHACGSSGCFYIDKELEEW